MNDFTLEFTPEEQLEIYSCMTDYTKKRLEAENISLCDIYSRSYDFESAELFSSVYKNLVNISKALNSGLMGERAAYFSLKILDYNTKILQTVQTPSYDPENSVEHDIIVITEKAIFTIEVKNINCPKVTITEQGTMIKENAYGQEMIGKNVVRQSKWHQTSLIKLLQGTKYEKVRVIPVLMFTNDMCSFENNFSTDENYMDFRVCYRATVDEILFDSRYSDCLSQEDMYEIEQIIMSANERYEPRRFKLFIDVKEYTDILEDFIKTAKEIRKQKEEKPDSVEMIRDYLDGLLKNNCKKEK
jgi:hypothetical protein